MTFYISCKDPNETSAEAVNWKTVKVTASAYNSLAYQNQGNPKITAWGDTLKPGMKVIAISRDLMKKGLVYNTPVKIDGLSGIFFVKDKMHHRWRNKIDIYMGEDVQKAKNWGRKKISIQYLVQKDSLIENIE
ncbi:3D domain-containing protein [Gillisia sp. Hel_I_86]|uniref:3D domain-containing protein n=1 Tax=Gillisia sp. Hel_I_86 TaxID=1249981 RepID=UPI0011A63128|nr:3D domain-containing protein [Gillisia sp. Hel_I_86]